MTVSMIARFKVNDFAKWKKAYDQAAQYRKEGSAIAENIHRDLDDPNTVTLYNQYPDASTAKAVVARSETEEAQAMLKRAGVTLPVEVWLLESFE